MNYSLVNNKLHSIQNSGTYHINEDILWNNKNQNNNIAIIIAANNVVLDGLNHTLTQKNVDIGWCFAIKVESGYENIEIRNVTIEKFSGGGIWIQSNSVTVNNVTMKNCGYLGMTIFNSKYQFTQGIIIDGGSLYSNPIENVKIMDCNFFEMGIFRENNKLLIEDNCGAILAYHGLNTNIEGCTVDGCCSKKVSLAITATDFTNFLLRDIFITDTMSMGFAKGVHIFNVDGEIKDKIETDIHSNLSIELFEEFLDNHPSVKTEIENDLYAPIEARLLKNVIPKHIENEAKLFKEHKWREFRTLGRLVCHNSHRKSITSSKYAKWVELFCERVLGVKVQVEAGFANLYLNGDTILPLHRDQYKKWIFGLSFGETRTLHFAPDLEDMETISYEMESGDVLLFSDAVNSRFQHHMISEPQRTGRRINITYFIEVLPGEDESKLLNSDIKKDLIPTFEEC